jgi:hypothetical protein
MYGTCKEEKRRAGCDRQQLDTENSGTDPRAGRLGGLGVLEAIDLRGGLEQGADWGALKRSSVLIGDAEAAVAEKVVVVRRSEGDGKEEERGRRNHEGVEDEVRGNKQRAAGFWAGERIWPVRVALAGRMTG